MEYNTYMKAYDVPLSALLFILWAGVPVEEYIVGPDMPTEEQLDKYIAMLRRIQKEGL
jgi:hypothetical protein